MTKKNGIIVLVIVAAAATFGLFLHRNYTLQSEEYKALQKFDNILSKMEENLEKAAKDSINSIEE